MLTEKVLPDVARAELERSIAAHGGDAEAAMAEFESSPLFQALETAEVAGGVKGDIEGFVNGYKEIAHAVRTGDWNKAADSIESLSVGGTKLDTSLAGIGLVLGAVAFRDASGFAARAQVILDSSESGAEILAVAAKSFSKVGTFMSAEALEKAAPVLGVVAGAVSGIKNLMDGNYGAAAVDGAGVALSLLAIAGVPGVGIAAGILAGGLFAYQLWKGHQENERRKDEVQDVMKDLGMEPGLVTFLTNSEPGAYENCKEELGLTDAQIRDLVKEGSPWTKQLDNFASPEFKEHVLPLLAPDGNVAAALDRLDDGLGTEGVQWISQILAGISGPSIDPYTGQPKPLDQQFNDVVTMYGGVSTPEQAQAERQLRDALGIG
jgi:hypothetical protein